MKVIARADNNALTLHNQQMEVICSHLDADLQLLRDKMDKALDAAYKCAQQELTDLQAQICVQHEITKAKLLNEVACMARKDCTARAKKRPNHLNSMTCSCSSSITLATPVPMEMANDLPPPSEYQLLSEAMQIVQMISEATPPAANKNSLTPKADIPLFPPHPTSTNPILDLLTMIQKQLEWNESHLMAIENQSHKPT
jgi:hypothetical protein